MQMDHSVDSEQKREMHTISAPLLERAGASEWESVFSYVKAQLPSLDSDTSESEGDDGDIFIFQRKDGNIIPDMSELMDILSDDPQMQIQETGEPSLLSESEPEVMLETLGNTGENMAFISGLDTSCDPVMSVLSKVVISKKSKVVLPNSSRSKGEEQCHDGFDSPSNVLNTAEDPQLRKLKPSQERHTKQTEVDAQQEEEILSHYPRAFSSPEISQHRPLQHAQPSNRSTPRRREIPQAKAQRGLSLHSLQCIEQWDLDLLLQNLKDQGDSLAQIEKVSDEAAFSDLPPLRSEADVMEQLKLLCARQSQDMTCICSSEASIQGVSTNQSDISKHQNKYSNVCLSTSITTESEDEILKYSPPPPTIYIDLRNVQPQKPEPVPAYVAEEGQEQSTDGTGKSLLLKQLHCSRKGHDPPTESPPLASSQTVESLQDIQSFEPGGESIIRRKRRTKVRVEWNKVAFATSPGLLEVKEELEQCSSLENPKMTSPKSPVQVRAETDLPLGPVVETTTVNSTSGNGLKEAKNDLRSNETPQEMQSLILLSERVNKASRAEERQAERAHREEELKEKHRRQRLQQQLESLKPRHSINGKQPMAEKTPVLFHLEASYMPDISILPAGDTVKQEMLLMTIWLSSCGHVASAGLTGGRLQETAIYAANIYHALVTWLISLVPTIGVHKCGTVSGSSNAPFQVVGLQQTWREDGLALYACLVPLPETPLQANSKTRKHKPKDDLRGMSTFYQKISKYLSHTWLQSVTWWREALTNRLQNQIFPVLPEVPAVRLSSVTTINPDPEAVDKAFVLPTGFYWQTMEMDEKICSTGTDPGIDADPEIEVPLALLFETLLSDPLAFHHMLQLILTSGLDICGLRLLYPKPNILLLSTDNVPSSYMAQSGSALPPVLALAFRGPQACTVWRDISGPSDPQLACLTDRHSLNALYCRSRSEPLLYSPHTEGRILQELCVWFGGRVPSDGLVHVGIQNPTSKLRPRSPSPSNPEREEGSMKDIALSRPPATLISSLKGDVFLAVSPAVPTSAYGNVISTCTLRGFNLQGIKRIRISTKRANVLSMAANQIAVFCRLKPQCPLNGKNCSEDTTVEPHLHTLLLLLRKENAGHHLHALLKGLMNEMAEQGFLAEIRSSLPPGTELQPLLCFHMAHYTDNLLQALGGSLTTVPEGGCVALEMLSQRTFVSNPELEQVVVLTLTGKEATKRAGATLRSILRPLTRKPNIQPENGNLESGFDLLALKWLPGLIRSQAKEITPFEVGDRPWQESIDQLVSSPVLICVLRRMNAFEVLAEVLKSLSTPVGRLAYIQGNLQRVMSSTPEIAFRQAALFFTDKDFVSDPRNRPTLKYIPPPTRGYRIEGQEAGKGVAESIFSYMLLGPQPFCTVMLMKPGIWNRNLAKFLRKLNMEKFRLVAMKQVKLDAGSASKLLPPEVLQDSAQVRDQCSYLTSDLSLALCLQRQNAVKKLLDILGPDDPSQAQDQFLWRGQYGTSPVKNGFYGSTSYQTAIRDMKIFFPEGLCCAQSPVLEEEKIFNVRSDSLVNLEFHRQRQAVRCKLKQQLSSFDAAATLSLSLPFHSALCQTTCLVLPEGLLQGCDHPPYVPLMEQLAHREFVLTGARLTRLDHSQAHLIAELLGPIDAISATRSLLTDSSCLVLAAQRDNAVSCFRSLMDSADCQKEVAPESMQLLLYPETEKQAEELLCCFFDSLTLNSIQQIVEKKS